MRRAAIYVRISQDRVGAGLGVARQEKDCRALCERLGWTVAGVFTDNDVSAYAGKVRKGYRAVLDALKVGDVDAVVAWHPDRLHRAPRELEDFIDAVDAAGAEVATVMAGEFDLSTASGRMTARILGAVSRQESEHKAERIRRKHLELAEAGKVGGGGRRPFGYEADRITIRPDEADLIREAARRVLAGERIRTIAGDWNRRGVPSVTGRPWSATTIKRLLESARISGQRTHQGRIVGRAVWPAIIDPDDTLRLRAVFRDPSRRLSDTNALSYLLSGMVTCGACGATMTARPVVRKGHRYRRYACVTDRGGCNRCGIGAAPLEAIVVDAVLLALDSKALARQLTRRVASGCEGPDAVAQLEARLAELAEMFAAGDIGRTAAGWLAHVAGRGGPKPAPHTPPWDSEELSRAVGVDPEQFDRHTALGDARWAKAIYDAVMGE